MSAKNFLHFRKLICQFSLRGGKKDLEDRAMGAHQLKAEDSNLTGRDFKYNLIQGPGFKYEKPRLEGGKGLLKRIFTEALQIIWG